MKKLLSIFRRARERRDNIALAKTLARNEYRSDSYEYILEKLQERT